MKGIIISQTHALTADKIGRRGDVDEPKFGGRKQKHFEGNSAWSNLSQYGMCGDAL